MKIILASASPRRRDLLSQAGFAFDAVPSIVDEKMEGDTPGQVVMSLAEQKAREVFERTHIQDICRQEGPDRIVLGADTIVVCDGKRLGKPESEAEAFSMLRLLSGRTHEVYTGVGLYFYRDGNVCREAFYECTKVTMYPISTDQARWYIQSKEPMDKAGAYGIQGLGAVFIKEITGDYNSVVGLPLARVWQTLYTLGLIRGMSDKEGGQDTGKVGRERFWNEHEQ